MLRWCIMICEFQIDVDDVNGAVHYKMGTLFHFEK